MAKLLITLALLCVFGAALVKGDKKEMVAKFMGMIDECKAKIGASEADIEEMMGHKPASTAEGKCLRACIMEKCGAMDSNGKFVKSVALAHAADMTDGDADLMKIATEMIETCGVIAVPDDHCEAAEQYCKCFKEQADAHGVSDKLKL